MRDDALDNPIHAALTSLHRACAIRSGNVLRHDAQFAPFLAVESDEVDVSAELSTLVDAEDAVYLLGVVPRVSADWSLKAYAPLAQMVCDAAIAVADGPEIIALGETHRADVLELTALVYPHYFRPRTMELGRYFGMYVEGRLAAMIGERLGSDTTREMSAICTHPDFLGRGYARRLTAYLSNRTLQEGNKPFLHVAYANARARGLYEQMGYRLRRDIGFFALRRG